MNLITILTCAVLNFAQPASAQKLSLKADTSYIDTAKYAIIQFDSVRDKYNLDKNSRSAALYATEIKKIEKVIRKEISIYNDFAAQGVKMRAIQKTTTQSQLNGIKNDPLTPNAISNPGKYYKQFIAVVNSKGEKEVWVECICKVSSPSWKKEPITAQNAGYCYFHLRINLTTGLTSDFGINSNA